jgi:flagellar basal-body rod modification protein FlgD
MDVSTISTTSGVPAGGTQSSQSAKKATLDYDAFLTLLIAQLRNQDPTEPQDSAEYIAQLATFSNVEQSIKTNAKLDELMTTFALSQAEGLIGRSVTSADGSVSGKVEAVKIVTGGAVAILEGGGEVELGAGIKIS